MTQKLGHIAWEIQHASAIGSCTLRETHYRSLVVEVSMDLFKGSKEIVSLLGQVDADSSFKEIKLGQDTQAHLFVFIEVNWNKNRLENHVQVDKVDQTCLIWHNDVLFASLNVFIHIYLLPALRLLQIIEVRMLSVQSRLEIIGSKCGQ